MIAVLATLAAIVTCVDARAAGGDQCAGATRIKSLPFIDSSGNTCTLQNDASNTGASACSDLPNAYPGPDAFYELVLGTGNEIAFDLTMASGATGDLALFLIANASCSGAGTCAANSIDVKGAGQGPERIKSASYPPGNYYVIVDSSVATGAGSCGAYTLSVTGSFGVSNTGPSDAGLDGAAPDGSSATDSGGTPGSGGTSDSGVDASAGATNAGGANAGGAGASSTGGAGGSGAGAAGSSSGGHSGSGMDSGTPSSGGESADASTPPSKSGSSGGCGCAVVGRDDSAMGHAAFAELAFVSIALSRAARRRRRR